MIHLQRVAQVYQHRKAYRDSKHLKNIKLLLILLLLLLLLLNDLFQFGL